MTFEIMGRDNEEEVVPCADEKLGKPYTKVVGVPGNEEFSEEDSSGNENPELLKEKSWPVLLFNNKQTDPSYINSS